MLQPLASTYFSRQPQFEFKLSSIFVFIVLALIAWGINILAQIAFPSPNLVPYLIRTATILGTDLCLIYVSFRLLKNSRLPAEALGLSVSKKTISDLLFGILIGAIAVMIIAALLYIYFPYHFVPGSINGLQALKESLSYLAGNTLEELMFRGFLFIIVSQLTDWRISALIMALPFGLFHLQGTGFSLNSWKIAVTTACYSLVFSFSFVLLRSMWTAISVHVVSNILLHAIIGLDGGNKAMLRPVFERSPVTDYDVSFIITIASALITSLILFLLILLLDKKHLKN